MKDLFAMLDSEPWLTLSAWADREEETGKEDRAKVLRWLIRHKRRPCCRPSAPKSKATLIPITPGSEYADSFHWTWREFYHERIEGVRQARAMWSILSGGSHCLPRSRRPTKIKFPSQSKAYLFAVDYLMVACLPLVEAG